MQQVLEVMNGRKCSI